MLQEKLVQILINNGLLPIQINSPMDWKPGSVVYVQYSLKFEPNGPSGTSWLNMYPKIGPFRTADTDIGKHIANIGKKIPPGNDLRYDPGPATHITMKPTDINVTEQSYVIVELDPGIDWQFRTDGQAITSKEYNSDQDTSLNHVNFEADGTATHNPDPHEAPSGDGCRLVYFKVVRRKEWDMNSLNFHIELMQNTVKRHPIECIFDPDVGNNGGAVYP